jgi:GAF domain-containing protein
VSGSRARADEIARLSDRIAELERLLKAARAPSDGAPGGDLHAEIVRQQRQAEELGRIARLVNESLDLRTVSGRAKEHAANGEAVPAGVGLVGRAAAEGRAMWTEDIRTDQRFERNPQISERNAALGIIAGLAVPLRVTGRVIGVLSVGSPMPRAFTEAEIALLQSFADQAAVAIYNAQNQQALASQAERLRILHEIDRALIAQQAPEGCC